MLPEYEILSKCTGRITLRVLSGIYENVSVEVSEVKFIEASDEYVLQWSTRFLSGPEVHSHKDFINTLGDILSDYIEKSLFDEEGAK
jgi:TorA maturation chaperone TorD